MSVDDEAIGAAKSLLRKAVRLRRDVRPVARRTADDEARTKQLQRELRALAPRGVACYLSAGSEPGTLEIVSWLSALGVPQILPVLTGVDGQRLDEPGWARYEGPGALRTGWRSIIEPTGTLLPPHAARVADVVLCPGLAGSADGSRLGRGGGWYDRALVTVAAPIWLLLNDDEVLDAVPQHGWDRPVDALVTPTRFIRCS